MKASTPAKGSGRRAPSGKVVGKARRPVAKVKKAAAPAKQATDSRRLATSRPKPKAVAKPAAKRTARPGASTRAARNGAPAARRSPAVTSGRAQRKPASAKRPATKTTAAAARKPATKAKRPASPSKRPVAVAKASRQQNKRAPRPAAQTSARSKPPANQTAAKTSTNRSPAAAAKPLPAQPAPKPPPTPLRPSVKLKPPPRSEAGSSAEAPVRVAAPLATQPSAAAPRPRAAAPGLAELQAAAPIPPPRPPMMSPGLARTLPNTHFVVRRDPPFIQPPMPSAKPVEFKSGDHVVYPTHGVGTVQGIETMSAAGYALQVIVVTFDENRMTLRVPIGKAASSGLRKLASGESMTEALDTLRGRARVKRTMWSRRAQEYEAKINSGDPVQIAEVVRDLHRNAGQPDQSFSERQIYEQAMDRLAAELAAIDRTDKPAATEKLLQHLNAM